MRSLRWPSKWSADGQPVSAPSNSYQPSRHSGSRRFPVCHRLEAHLEFKSGTTPQRSQRQTKPRPLTRPVAQSRCSRLLQLPCHSTSQREARAVPSSALLAVVGNRRLPQRDECGCDRHRSLFDRWAPYPRIVHPYPGVRFDATYPG